MHSAPEYFLSTPAVLIPLPSPMVTPFFLYLPSMFDASLWGVFIADVVIQSMGSDYARIVRAIFAIAQVTTFDHWHNTPSLNGGF